MRNIIASTRPPLVARALLSEAARLRADAVEMESLCGGDDALLHRMAAGLRSRAAAAERLALALKGERVAA